MAKISLTNGVVIPRISNSKPFRLRIGDYDKVEIASIVQVLVDEGIVSRLPTGQEQRLADSKLKDKILWMNGL